MTTTERARPSAAATTLGWVANLLIIGFVLLMGYLLWPYAVKQYYGTPAPVEQQAAPALIAPTPARLPAPVYAPAPAPIVVQQVPAGEAPQPVQFQPVAAPADSAEPAPRPIVIVQHVNDNGNQSITGSGACAVARVAARCGK